MSEAHTTGLWQADFTLFRDMLNYGSLQLGGTASVRIRKRCRWYFFIGKRTLRGSGVQSPGTIVQCELCRNLEHLVAGWSQRPTGQRSGSAKTAAGSIIGKALFRQILRLLRQELPLQDVVGKADIRPPHICPEKAQKSLH